MSIINYIKEKSTLIIGWLLIISYMLIGVVIIFLVALPIITGYLFNESIKEIRRKDYGDGILVLLIAIVCLCASMITFESLIYEVGTKIASLIYIFSMSGGYFMYEHFKSSKKEGDNINERFY